MWPFRKRKRRKPARVDEETLRQTKEHIRRLLAEIAQTAGSLVSESEFFDKFLCRVVTALAAHGGVVWRTECGQLETVSILPPACDVGAVAPEELAAHVPLLRHVLKSGQPMLVPPRSQGDRSSTVRNPTEHLLLIGLVRQFGTIGHVVEVFQRSQTAESVQRGYLRFLSHACRLAERHFEPPKTNR